jgi:signal transduction histidine kinase
LKLNIRNQWIELSIKDTGIGLTEDEIEIIFLKFSKIGRARAGYDIDPDGSGLGLYISKEIIELHNGEILVESDGPEKGSTFTIRLPRSV